MLVAGGLEREVLELAVFEREVLERGVLERAVFELAVFGRDVAERELLERVVFERVVLMREAAARFGTVLRPRLLADGAFFVFFLGMAGRYIR